MSEGGAEEKDESGALERFLVSPWTGMALVVSGVATGLLGSIYTDELKRLMLVVVSLSATAGAALFIVLVIVTGAAVFFRQRTIDAQRAKVQKRFDKAAADIPELIRTLPEQSFQNEFGIIFEKLSVMMQGLRDTPSRAQGVTVALQGFATLAGKFDAGRLDDRFAANLMVYLTGAAREPWMPLLKFFDRNPNTLAGVLVMPVEFAALADGEDKDVAEFALPVPLDLGRAFEEPGGKGWRVLPGAPFAHARNQFEHYSKTALLEDWCRDSGDFNEVEIGAMIEYFASQVDKIGGFMCIPIRVPTSGYVNEADRQSLGVLNIHWNRCDRLCNAHSAKLFAKATYPLQVLLAQTLTALLADRPPVPGSRLSTTPPPEAEPPKN